MQCSGPSPRTALLRLQEGDNAVGAPHQTSLTSTISLIFSHSPFQPRSIFSKFLQALPLGCDCAFHSGREHQDLLPPEGRIVSDTYISQKSQTSQIPCMSDVTDWCQGQLWSFVTQRLANWEPVAGGPALPKVGHQQHLFESFFNFHILRFGPLARFLTLCMVHCPAWWDWNTANSNIPFIRWFQNLINNLWF